jgi:hypothetical protein
MCPAKRGAGDPGYLDPEHDVVESPDLSDERVGRVDPDHGEVLAEGAGGQGPTELALPPLLVLAGVGIDRLLGSAVVLGVADLVADDTAAQPTALRPGITHLDEGVLRQPSLGDGRRRATGVRAGDGGADVDRHHVWLAHRVRLPSRQVVGWGP